MRNRLLLLTLLGLAGCLGARQLLAETVMVATLLGTPDVTVGGLALASDGGTASDAGVTIQGATIAFVYLGQREQGALDQPPVGIRGASVTVEASGGAAIRIPEEADGRYQRTSAQDPALRYRAGSDYQFQATQGGATYTGSVDDAPAPETIPELHPAGGFVLLDAGRGLTLTRPPAPAGRERPLGFVTVFQLRQSGALGDVTYTNLPDSPLEVLQLVARPSNWRRTQVEIPGTAFPSAGSNYLVAFTAAKLGRPTSANLFVGSAILAGVADVGVIRTR